MPENTDTNTETKPEKTQYEQMADWAASQPAKVPAAYKKEDGSIDLAKLADAYKKQAEGAGTSGTEEEEAKGELTLDSIFELEDTGTGSADETLEEALGLSTKKSEIDWAAVEKEVLETGTMSSATLKAVRASGIPDSVIKATVKGYLSTRQEHYSKVASVLSPDNPAEGKKIMSKVLAYVNKNYTPEQKKAILEALQGPAGEETLRGLHQKWALVTQAANPTDTSRGGGASPGASPAQYQPFRTNAEMLAALQDTRYRSDPDFQKEVMIRAALAKGVSPERIKQLAG